MYDLVQWFLMPSTKQGLKLPNGQVYGRETDHLEGLNLTNNTKVYAYHYDSGQSMWFTKTPQGFPWDVKAYDTNFIYDTATELDWKTDRDFKKMNPQLSMCPRYWNGDPTLYQFHQNATYDVYQNCIVTGHGNVGPAYYTIQHIGGIDYQGDVKVADTILLSYYWGMDPTKTISLWNREQLFLTATAGWVDWTHAVRTLLAPGLWDYVVDARVTHNMIVPGSLTPRFSCIPQIP